MENKTKPEEIIEEYNLIIERYNLINNYYNKKEDENYLNIDRIYPNKDFLFKIKQFCSEEAYKILNLENLPHKDKNNLSKKLLNLREDFHKTIDKGVEFHIKELDEIKKKKVLDEIEYFNQNLMNDLNGGFFI